VTQVPIFQCLAKFDGTTISDDIRLGRRKFRVTRLPNFLALQVGVKFLA
jgi:U4/U6.U5 tri-snRNP-associated protein 2